MDCSEMISLDGSARIIFRRISVQWSPFSQKNSAERFGLKNKGVEPQPNVPSEPN